MAYIWERERERKKDVSYCTASSLVGVNIKTRIAGILRGRNRSLSSNGSAKAAVWKHHRKIKPSCFSLRHFLCIQLKR